MPRDQWKFVSASEEFDDPDPEEAALHISEGPPPTPAEDPGLAEVELADHTDGEEASAAWYQDEEPEGLGLAAREPEIEQDLEELLEEQHYAFGPPDDDR